MKIDNLTIQQVKDAADIVSVVEDFVDLKRQGANFAGLCPFHDDHHIGNFFVSPAKNVASCFACSWSGGPIDFLMKTGKTFPDAIRYCASKFGIPIEGEKPMTVKRAPRRVPTPELPTMTWSIDMAKSYMPFAKDTAFGRWFLGLPWSDDEREMAERWLALYAVGGSKQGSTQGWTIWWYIDDKMRVRTGKLMKYGEDGHRDKASRYNFNFIHSLLAKAGKFDAEKYKTERCLFGLHLVDCFPEAEVCIVESEKSAIICQTVSNPGEKIFMATGSKSSLNAKMLEPLISRGRKILLYPDIDATESWGIIGKAIGYANLQVSDRVRKNYRPEIDGKKADIADIIIRLLTKKDATESEKAHTLLGLKEENEGLKTLIEGLDLKIQQWR